MEAAASIPTPRRCQLRQLVSSKAPSVLAPQSTLPRQLPAFATSSCPCATVTAACSAAPGPPSPPTRLHSGRPGGHHEGRRRYSLTDAAARLASRRAGTAGRRRGRGRGSCACMGSAPAGRSCGGRWAPEVTARLDLVFADGPFSAEGASRGRRPRLDPPYYEWCQFVGEDFLSCRNLDGCFAYLEELMGRDGPFDGLLGFSQGAGLSAALAGFQQKKKKKQQRLAFTGVAKVKCVIVIAGAKIRAPVAVARAFDSKITCPSLHFIGDEDFVKVHSEELVQAFADPLVLRHPCGHTVPKLDEKGLQTMLTYLDKIEREIWKHSSTGSEIMGSN